MRQFRNRNQSSNVDENADADDAVQATDAASSIDQLGHGLRACNWLHTGRPWGRPNKLSFGASIDRGRARYQRSSRPASFTADRGTVAAGDFVPETDADTSSDFIGVFGSDAFGIAPHWTLTLAGRYNRADVRIADRSGVAPELNGLHRFERFNPAVGLNFNPTPGFTAYAGYNEGMRAPTAIELTCADPAVPCRLPNAFLADPPLKKVVSRTVEIGARGRLSGRVDWNAALFQTVLQDDLQFVSSNGTALNAGYFQNVGRTRRQGLEARRHAAPRGLQRRLRLWLSPTRPTSTASSRTVRRTRPPTPTARSRCVQATAFRRSPAMRSSCASRSSRCRSGRWRSTAAGTAACIARGDENNRDAAGRVPGYAVLNLAQSLACSRGAGACSDASTTCSTAATRASGRWRATFSPAPAAASAPCRETSSSAATARRAAPGSGWRPAFPDALAGVVGTAAA